MRLRQSSYPFPKCPQQAGFGLSEDQSGAPFWSHGVTGNRVLELTSELSSQGVSWQEVEQNPIQISAMGCGLLEQQLNSCG